MFLMTFSAPMCVNLSELRGLPRELVGQQCFAALGGELRPEFPKVLAACCHRKQSFTALCPVSESEGRSPLPYQCVHARDGDLT